MDKIQNLQKEIAIIVADITKYPNPPESIKIDADLFDAGTLDSVMIVGLLAKIENRFGITVPPEEFRPENFSSIAGMSAMVLRLIS